LWYSYGTKSTKYSKGDYVAHVGYMMHACSDSISIPVGKDLVKPVIEGRIILK